MHGTRGQSPPLSICNPSNETPDTHLSTHLSTWGRAEMTQVGFLTLIEALNEGHLTVGDNFKHPVRLCVFAE